MAGGRSRRSRVVQGQRGRSGRLSHAKAPWHPHPDAVRVFQKLGYRIIRQSGHIVMSNGEIRLVAW